MKEFLTKNNHGNYELVYREWRDDDIEIPEGADLYVYWPENDTCNFQADKSYFENGSWNLCAWHVDEIKSGEAGAEVLWKRQPEIQEPLDDVKWLEGDLKEAKLDKQLSKVDLTLLERQSQYGCFEDVAFVTQGIIALLRKCNYDNMPQPHQMALYMIASKMARLVNGDHNHLDSWHDIGGYSKLIENLIGGEDE